MPGGGPGGRGQVGVGAAMAAVLAPRGGFWVGRHCLHPAPPPPHPTALQTELESFLVEITASIFKKKDEMGEGFLIDKVLDKTGMKVRRGVCVWGWGGGA